MGGRFATMLKQAGWDGVVVQGKASSPVDLSSLPIRSIAIKEMAFENGQRVFKGAYFVNGYSLYGCALEILHIRPFGGSNVGIKPAGARWIK
jgi:aldehyde:ferredoxin oxidoreductase